MQENQRRGNRSGFHLAATEPIFLLQTQRGYTYLTHWLSHLFYLKDAVILGKRLYSFHSTNWSRLAYSVLHFHDVVGNNTLSAKFSAGYLLVYFHQWMQENPGTAIPLVPFGDSVAYTVNCVSKKSESLLGWELSCSCFHSWTHYVHASRLVGNQAAELKESGLESPVWLAEAERPLLRRGICQLTPSRRSCENREYLQVFKRCNSHSWG